MRKISWVKSLALLLMLFFGRNTFAGELLQVPAVMGISSRVSDGRYTIPEIAGICEQNGIKALIITDRDLMRWEYGVWPLRNMLKWKIEENSIFKYGVRKYLSEFEAIRKQHPGMVMIPAIESAPFYYWSGSLMNSDLELRNWHKHILAVGVDDPGILERIPVIGNSKALFKPFSPADLLLLWPGIFVALGWFFRGRKVLAAILAAAGFLGLVNNFPFRAYKFDQYRINAGIRPYQNYIDYVNRHNGMTFWAHLEAANIRKMGAVTTSTGEHSFDLLLSRDYTGFAVFYEGFKTAGKINGTWDTLLKDYCRGARRKPVWAVASLSYDSIGRLEDALADQRLVLLVPQLNSLEVLKALRAGRMYMAIGRNSSKFVLGNFSLFDPSVGEAYSGAELSASGPVQVRIKADILNGQSKPIRIKLIRNGLVLKSFEEPAPCDIVYSEEQPPAEERYYYRLEISSDGIVAVTNPIFVKRKL